jgi:hypothetical protein
MVYKPSFTSLGLIVGNTSPRSFFVNPIPRNHPGYNSPLGVTNYRNAHCEGFVPKFIETNKANKGYSRKIESSIIVDRGSTHQTYGDIIDQ